MFFARVRLYNPEGWTVDGDLFVTPASLEWQTVQHLLPSECDHVVSMCSGCLDTWEIDYEVQLPCLI